MSRPLGESLQPLVLSVVCGDDLVPRLSVAAVERLKRELETELSRCTLSKVSTALSTPAGAQQWKWVQSCGRAGLQSSCGTSVNSAA